jgi:HK97 family phage major capsid protein
MLAYNGPRRVARVIRTDTGNPLDWPTFDDTSNIGEQLGEAADMGSSVDPVIGTLILNSYKYSSKPVLMSHELIQDSAFNMGNEVATALGVRLGRIQAQRFTTGTGSGQPHGIVTASTLGKTAASATAIAADEILDLIHSIDPAYRSGPSVGFMLNDSSVLAIRKLKDGNGQYLWQPGMQTGTPDSIFARPYTVNQEMESIATAKKTVLFGDMSKFVIRDVSSLRFYRLEELYRAKDQTGFVAFLQSDSELIQPAAVKHLVQA